MRISFCELTNLRFGLKREKYLGYGLSIRRVPSYIGQIIDHDRGFTVPFPHRRWMIFGAQQRDYFGRPDWEIANNVRVLVDALLLYCGENIEVGAKFECEYYGKGNANLISKLYGGVFNDRAMGHNEMSLTNEQVLRLKGLFSLLMNVYDSHFIQIPLTFYREACVSRAIPWKIAVYLTIALESIFLIGESNKAFELAKRVADFLSHDNHHEDDIYREVFALYKYRNAIVHDGNQAPVVQVTESRTGIQFEFNCTDLTRSGYNTVRRCMRKILDTQMLDKQKLLRLVHSRSRSLQRPTLQSNILST